MMASETNESSSQKQHNVLATENVAQVDTVEKQEQQLNADARGRANATEASEEKQQPDPKRSSEQQSMTESRAKGSTSENSEFHTIQKIVKSEQTNEDDRKEKPTQTGSADRSEAPSTPQRDEPQAKNKSSKRLRFGPSQRNKSGPRAKNGSYHNYYKRRYNGIHGDDRLPFVRDAVKLQGKNISLLDVGCNDGTVTIEMASLDRCIKAVGVDIDPNLVGAARKKLREYVDKEAGKTDAELAKPNIQGPVPKSNDALPLSLRRSLNLMKQAKEKKEDRFSSGTDKDANEEEEFANPSTKSPGLRLGEDLDKFLRRAFRDTEKKDKEGGSPSVRSVLRFPYNVTFRREDFAHKDPTRTSQETEKYDVVLCLSVTKWVHFAGGDEALKRLFRRLHACLKPGGVLILEPQPQKSYKSAIRKGLGKKDFKGERKLKPPKFPEYLTKTVGFTKMRMLRDVRHRGQAFNRPIMAFYKQKEQEMHPSGLGVALSDHADAFLGIVPSDNEGDELGQPEQGDVAEGQDGPEEQQAVVQNEVVVESVDGNAALETKEEGEEKNSRDGEHGKSGDEASGEREREDAKEQESSPQGTLVGLSNADGDASALEDTTAAKPKESDEAPLTDVVEEPNQRKSDVQAPVLPSSDSKPHTAGQDVEGLQAQCTERAKHDQEEEQHVQTGEAQVANGVAASSPRGCDSQIVIAPSCSSKRRSTDQAVEGTKAHSPKRSKHDQDEKKNEPESSPKGPSS